MEKEKSHLSGANLEMIKHKMSNHCLRRKKETDQLQVLKNYKVLTYANSMKTDSRRVFLLS